MKLISISSFLLAALISAEASGLERNNLLVDSAFTGKTEVVRLSIESGSDPDTVNYNNASLVLVAAMRNNIELLTFLLNRGANPDIANNKNATPLYAASNVGSTKAVQVLLQYGADPNIAMNEYIATPLMSAAVNGYVEIVKYLLSSGARTDTKNTKGKTVLDLIDKNPHSEVHSTLLEYQSGAPNKNRLDDTKDVRQL